MNISVINTYEHVIVALIDTGKDDIYDIKSIINGIFRFLYRFSIAVIARGSHIQRRKFTWEKEIITWWWSDTLFPGWTPPQNYYPDELLFVSYRQLRWQFLHCHKVHSFTDGFITKNWLCETHHRNLILNYSLRSWIHETRKNIQNLKIQYFLFTFMSYLYILKKMSWQDKFSFILEVYWRSNI